MRSTELGKGASLSQANFRPVASFLFNSGTGYLLKLRWEKEVSQRLSLNGDRQRKTNLCLGKRLAFRVTRIEAWNLVYQRIQAYGTS